MYQVKGKQALITGAARGIGYLTAKFMAQQGCNLILQSRSTVDVDNRMPCLYNESCSMRE